MCITTKIKKYLKCLLLLNDSQNQNNLLNEILVFLKSIQTEHANGNEEIIAKLFCRTIEALDQNSIPCIEIQSKIIEAFKNIKTIVNNEQKNGELMCIYLLNFLYSQQSNLSELDEEVFVNLLSNLEKIRVVFKITDEQKNLVFPIASLLSKLILCDDLLEKINNVGYIQALMLALQVFNEEQYRQAYNNINSIISGKNLKFIEYLFDKGCLRIGDDEWKANFENNGLLILYNPNINKVLIRNKEKKYFEKNLLFDDDRYNIKICVEKNAVDEPIAYFIEYDWNKNDAVWVDLEKEFSAKNNCSRISQIINIIYCYKNFNVGYKRAMYCVDKKIYLTNPYGNNDLYYVENCNAYEDGIQRISKLLYKYGLNKIAGSGLNYINLGLLIKMNEINAIPFEEYKLSDKSTFNDVLKNWLIYSKGNLDYFNIFFKDYIKQIKYIFDENEMYKKEYENEYLIPNIISKDIVQVLAFDDKFKKLSLEEVNIKNSIYEDGLLIENKDRQKLLNYEVLDIDGNDLRFTNEKVVALVDTVEKKIYIGKHVDFYYNLFNKIEEINSHALDNDVLYEVNENEINDLVNVMSCFIDALSDIHRSIPIQSIVRYRIINHFIFLKHVLGEFNKNDVKNWLMLIKKHQIIDYSIIKEKLFFDSECGVLYVPKERARSEGTLKFIIEKYLNDNISRNEVSIYDQKITFKHEKYYVRNSTINKIIFLFDIIQNGKATIRSIDNYLDKHSKTNECLTFICNGNEITVLDILAKNNCSIEIHSIYAGKTGIENVKAHVSSKYKNLNINVLQPLRELNVMVDKKDIELIKKFYPNKLSGVISEKDYLVVREYNQPKHNIMCDELLDLRKVVSIFCKRSELNF